MIKVAAVSYLNARPLVESLRQQPHLDVRDLPPAAAAEALLSGEAQVGLVPSVTLLRDSNLTYLPGLCIGADGPVDSVLLYLRSEAMEPGKGPLRIALDPHSRTSQMLTRIYLENFCKIEPARLKFEEVSPKPLLAEPSLAERYDGILVIGDLALREVPLGDWQRIDLAEAWAAQINLPFVFAVWGLRSDTLAANPTLPESFQSALENGLAQIDTIAQDMAPGFGIDEGRASHYLTERIVFQMDERAERGLHEFLDRCRAREK